MNIDERMLHSVWPGHPEDFDADLDQLAELLATDGGEREVVRGLARIAASYELALAQAVREFLERCAAGDVLHVVDEAKYLAAVDAAYRRSRSAVKRLQSAYDRGDKDDWSKVAERSILIVRALVLTTVVDAAPSS